MYGDATSPANPFGSQAGEAWNKGHTACGTVWVGVIDEGYMHTHEDLAGNAGTNPQYGATSVDIGAPGSGIWSTVPKRAKGKVFAGYASYSGTSMATPHVAGAAALYKSSHPGATAADIKAAILAAAVPTPSLNGKVVSNGRLNVSGF